MSVKMASGCVDAHVDGNIELRSHDGNNGFVVIAFAEGSIDYKVFVDVSHAEKMAKAILELADNDAIIVRR